MQSSPENDLIFLAMKADPNVSGGAVLKPGRAPEPGWFVYERTDGIVVRLDTINGERPTPAAEEAVYEGDVSAEAHAERVAKAQKNETVQLFLADESPTARCVRAIARTMVDWVNELRMVRIVGFAVSSQNLPPVAAGSGLTSPVVPVAGAVVGDGVFVSPPFNTQGLVVYAYVSAPDSVVIRVQNGTNAAIDIPAGDWGVGVFRIKSPAYTDADLAAKVTAHVEAE